MNDTDLSNYLFIFVARITNIITMETLEESWNMMIDGGFRYNPIFKDVLRELTKDFKGSKWPCVEEVLIKKGAFNERNSKNEKIVEKIVETNVEKYAVKNKARLARALTYIGLEQTVHSIAIGLGENKSVSTDMEFLEDMLPMKANKTYSSFDKDSLTDDLGNYSFMSTDDTIVYVEKGVISCGEKDGTCIIMMQSKENAADRKYYKVKVEKGMIYDASKNTPCLVSMGQSVEGGQTHDDSKESGTLVPTGQSVEGGQIQEVSKESGTLVFLLDEFGQNPEPNDSLEGMDNGHECVDLGLSVKWATCNVGADSPGEYGDQKPVDDNGHECVDLGLSVKWATCNVGAGSPGGYGDYFVWGEISPKSSDTWKNLRYRVSGDTWKNVTFRKYLAECKYPQIGNRRCLGLSDDAARQQWGGSWRMPTIEEFMELDKCRWSWTTEGGHKGYKVTGPSGNSIFLPAAGFRGGSSLRRAGEYGGYWSSSFGSLNSYRVGLLSFNCGIQYVNRYYNPRNYGQSVRPVTE